MKKFLIKLACIPLVLVCIPIFIYALLAEPKLIIVAALVCGGLVIGRAIIGFIVNKIGS